MIDHVNVTMDEIRRIPIDVYYKFVQKYNLDNSADILTQTGRLTLADRYNKMLQDPEFIEWVRRIRQNPESFTIAKINNTELMALKRRSAKSRDFGVFSRNDNAPDNDSVEEHIEKPKRNVESITIIILTPSMEELFKVKILGTIIVTEDEITREIKNVVLIQDTEITPEDNSYIKVVTSKLMFVGKILTSFKYEQLNFVVCKVEKNASPALLHSKQDITQSGENIDPGKEMSVHSDNEENVLDA